ncbi:helix-turn-helix domain-containing protein [Actinosynnema sp. NPDC049800]
MTTARALQALPVDGPPAPLGQQQSIEATLRGTHRAQVPIRKTFVQQGRGKNTTPGPLAEFLTSRDQRGLDAYLLIHALASAWPWNCNYPSGFWVRALGLARGKALSVEAIDQARPAVSKIMKRLVDRKLISRTRDKRRASLTLLCEDGSGHSYQRPFDADERWFALPHAYWYQGHYRTLSLAAKVVLLIALERPDDFPLPQERAHAWYGISADSADRGLRELRNAGLLHVKQTWVEEPKSDIGYTQRWTYRLLGPYSTDARNIAAAVAKANFEGAAKEVNA